MTRETLWAAVVAAAGGYSVCGDGDERRREGRFDYCPVDRRGRGACTHVRTVVGGGQVGGEVRGVPFLVQIRARERHLPCRPQVQFDGGLTES